MNNEQNKPTELTEKELAGIAGGARDLVTVTGQEVEWEVEKKVAVSGDEDRVGISPVSPVDMRFFKAKACE